MKLYCKHCKKIIIRSKKDVDRLMTKRGYKSYCEKTGKNTFLKIYDESENKFK